MAKRVRGDMKREIKANRPYQRGNEHCNRGRKRSVAFWPLPRLAWSQPSGTSPISFDHGMGVKADENAVLCGNRRAYWNVAPIRTHLEEGQLQRQLNRLPPSA